MPKFLDVHPMKGFTEESLRKAQTELTDEFGVTTENMMFNIEADRLYCLLNAPNKEAVENTTTNMVSNAIITTSVCFQVIVQNIFALITTFDLTHTQMEYDASLLSIQT
jgi:hypothetical protein